MSQHRPKMKIPGQDHRAKVGGAPRGEIAKLALREIAELDRAPRLSRRQGWLIRTPRLALCRLCRFSSKLPLGEPKCLAKFPMSIGATGTVRCDELGPAIPCPAGGWGGLVQRWVAQSRGLNSGFYGGCAWLRPGQETPLLQHELSPICKPLCGRSRRPGPSDLCKEDTPEQESNMLRGDALAICWNLQTR